MSAEEALFRAQATTSVYDNEASDPLERHLLTLSESRAEYAALPPPPPPLAPGTLAAPTTDANAPEIVVQVRKRKGGVELLLDGYVSQGVRSDARDNTRVHNLTWHRGMHEDAETDTRVFSPLAFVAAIEDGQHPLQGVKVGVVQVYANNGAPVGEAVLLAEATLIPHRVYDVRCNVLRTPYPLSYPPQLKVMIMDNAKRIKQQSKSYLDEYSSTLTTTAATFVQGVAVAGIEWQLAAAYGVLAGGAGLIATLATAYGWRWTRALMTRMKQKTGELTEPTNPQAGGQFVDTVNAATKAYLTEKPLPDDRKVVMTLEEFTKTLESLSLVQSGDPNSGTIPNPFSDAQNDSDHRKEHVMWNWLDDPEYTNIGMADMAIRDFFTTTMHIRVSVDDSMACSPGTQYHEIHCDREDVCALAAAAAGAIRTIERARKAVLKLSEMLDEGLRDSKGEYYTWFDRRVLGPVWWMSQAVASNFAENRLQGVFNGTTKVATKFKLTDASMKARNTQFLAVKTLLKRKLIDPFFADDSPVNAVLRQMEVALRDTRLPQTPSTATWVRKLPQRVRAVHSGRLFASGAPLSTEYADTITDGVTVREFSRYESATKAFTESMRASTIALARFVPQWEASLDTRIALVCRCTSVTVTQTSAWQTPHGYSTLVLFTPADIQFAASIVSIPERTRRRLRLVAKRAQSRDDKSVLEALGLRHANADLLACQIFGDLWIAELLAMYAAGGGARQVQMLERASARAATRLRAAGEHLLLLVGGGGNASGGEDAATDFAPHRRDIALVATQAGRDAGLLLDRVLFSQNYYHVRAAMAPLIRNCAHTAVRAAAAFEKSPPTRLPHAPTASLFGHPHDGAAAFLRARAVEGDGGALAPAMTAAYPSARLLEAGQIFSEDELNARAPLRKTLALPRRQLVAAMRFRMASLQLEPNPDEAENLSVDELAEALAAVKLERNDRTFYVPFGFGDARPAPTLPPCAAPMFGTVPVFGADLVEAFADLARCLRARPADGAPSKQPLHILLKPTLDCLRDPLDDPEIEGVHPNMVHLKREESGRVVATYAASRAPPEDEEEEELPPLEDDQGNAQTTRALTSDAVARAAEAHVCSKESVRVASQVSSLAWNAERVVQAVVASLASAELGQEFDAVALTLTLPPDSDERSYWYSAEPSPYVATQRRNVYNREVNRQLDQLHLLTLQFVGLLEQLYLSKLSNSSVSSWSYAGVRPADMKWSSWCNQEREDAFNLPVERPDVGVGVPAEITLGDPDVVKDGDLTEITQTYDVITTAEVVLLEYLQANEAVESEYERIKAAKALFKINTVPAAAAAPASNEASRRALVGALGVGVAMLRPLLAELPVTCEAVDGAGDDAESLALGADGATSAFAKCAAVRLSEACLVVVGPSA